MARRRNRRGLVAIALLALVATLVVQAPASALPATPTGLSPAGGDFADNPQLRWNPVTGATSYRVQVATNPAFTSPLYNATTVNTTFTPYNALPTGPVYWRVAAIDLTGTGAYAEESFTRTLLGPDQTAPADGAVLAFPDVPITFSWQKQSFAKSYVLEIDDATDFIGPTTVKTAATSYTLPSTKVPGQAFYWRVRGATGAAGTGVLTDWSDTWEFETSWLAQPGLVKPPDNTAVPITDIELEWTPVLGADHYDLQIAKDVDFNVIEQTATAYGTRFSPPITLNNGSYHWRVRAVDVDGHAGTWSGSPANPFSFTRSWTPTPNLVTPLATLNNPILFEWTPTQTPSADDPHLETYYEVQVATDPGFGTNLRTCITAQTRLMQYSGGSGAPGSCSSSFFDLDAGTTYYWHVRGKDAPESVIGIWSATEDFTYVGPPTPSAGAIMTPATPTAPPPCVLPCVPVTSSPTFAWDPVPGADYYKIYLSYDANFTNLAHSTWTVDQFTTFIPREELPDNDAGQAYFWHVQSCDADPNPDVCSLSPVGTLGPVSSTFQKRSAEVVLSAPADGATVANLPRFSWEDYQASNPSNISAERYRIQVATDPSFASPIENRLVDQNFYTPYSLTYPEGPLWWRVRAIDASGNELTWSPARTLTKSSPGPALTSPANGAHVVGIPTFAWQGQPFAAEYVIEVYENDPGLTFPPANKVASQTTAYSSFTPIAPLPVGADYSWRVRREDGLGKDGPWSAGRLFDVTSIAPTLVSPANNAVLLNDANVFSWNGIDAAASYRYERSSSPAFTTIAESRVTVMTSWAPLVTIPDGTWYWRVVALDAGDDPLATSAARTFTRDTQDLPSAPTALKVTNNPGQSIISWSPPDHPGDPAFTQYRVTLTPGGPTRTVSSSVRSVTLNGLTNGTFYTVNVVAINSDGTSPPLVGSAKPNGCATTPFSDVEAGHPFCAEIAWLFGEGITTGTTLPDGRVLYKPSDPVSRQAMAAFLYRFDGEPTVGLTSPFFGDVPATHPFYDAIQWMAESGNSTGTPNPPGKPLYKPNDSVSRQAMSAFLHRYAGDDPPATSVPIFADVPSSHVFFGDIQWMGETGLSLGTPNPPGKPLYKPSIPVTRQAMAAFLYRFDTEILGP